MEIFNFEVGKTHVINLMPNINDIPNSVLEYRNAKYSIYTCYALIDNKIEIIRFGSTVFKDIKKRIEHHYVNTKGNLLCTYFYKEEYYPDLKSYTINNGIVKLYDSDHTDADKGSTDIIEHSPMNLFDINSGLTYLITKNLYQGFPIMDLRVVQGEPLYTKGDDQQPILDLYKDVKPLEEVIDELKIKYDNI